MSSAKKVQKVADDSALMILDFFWEIYKTFHGPNLFFDCLSFCTTFFEFPQISREFHTVLRAQILKYIRFLVFFGLFL